MRRFKIIQKSPPEDCYRTARLLGEGVLFGNGKVAVMDYGHEAVLPYRSLEHLVRERVVGFEIDWIDGVES